jgi:hypothetical protein
MMKNLIFCLKINTAIILFISVYAFIIPAITIVSDLQDDGLYSNKIPNLVFRTHKAISQKYAKWAQKRVHTGEAAKLSTSDVAGTEWPIFGSVFYLWATEAIQEAYQENHKLARSAPKDYAHEAIEAATALIVDPNHATWVRQYWGYNYLKKENLFYRMLLISGLTSYQKLTSNNKYESLLCSQVESLSKELDESPHGLLDDYPGQCYPVDIVPAIAAIRRADAVLDTNHSEFSIRAIRGFQDNALDKNTDLPAYNVDSKTGYSLSSARGVGLSYMLIWAPELWPQTAKEWYGRYEQLFWQQNEWIKGFREFPRENDREAFSNQLFFEEVDAGPVIAGYGVAASAFGIGATRAMGRFDHAYLLAAQAIAVSLPMINGTLLGPRILSSMSDAPYLGEAAMLFALSRKSVDSVTITERPKPPWSVYVIVFFLLFTGIFEILISTYKLRRWKHYEQYIIPFPKIQFDIWLILVISAVIIWTIKSPLIGLIYILFAQLIPIKLWKHPKSRNPV